METLSFKNSKGQKLVGILEDPDPKSKKVVIIVHGHSSHKNRSSAKQISEELINRKINSFRIDLDGCGESEGKFEEQNITTAVDDISSAIELMKKKGYKDIQLFGSSAGGLAAMATALKHPEITRLGLKAPVSDYGKQKREKLGMESISKWKTKGYISILNGQGQKLRLNYSFYEDIQKYNMHEKGIDIKCPVLIIHGDADDCVKLEQSEDVVRIIPNAKLIALKGADHGLSIKGDRSKANKLFGDWFSRKDTIFK